MKIPEKNLAEQIFTQFCIGYKNRDLDSLLSLMTKNVNMWGTGIDEHRVGLKQAAEQLQRDWSQSEKSAIDVVSFIPTPHNALWTAATCHAKLTIDGKEHVFEHLRGTIIIEKEDDAWKISHMHASFPDYRNAPDGSFPVVKS